MDEAAAAEDLDAILQTKGAQFDAHPKTANRKPQTANRKPQTANRKPQT